MYFKHKWYLLHIKLYNLGFFLLKKTSNSNTFASNAIVAFHTSARFAIHTWNFYKILKKIVPLFTGTSMRRPNMHFFALGVSGMYFFEKFFSLLEKSTINIVFDWGFGVITNRRRMFFNYYKNSRVCFQEHPEIAFLLSILGRQKVVTTELRNAQIISTGITEYGEIGYVDFPIPSNADLKYVYIYFRLAIRLIAMQPGFFSYARI